MKEALMVSVPVAAVAQSWCLMGGGQAIRIMQWLNMTPWNTKISISICRCKKHAHAHPVNCQSSCQSLRPSTQSKSVVDIPDAITVPRETFSPQSRHMTLSRPPPADREIWIGRSVEATFNYTGNKGWKWAQMKCFLCIDFFLFLPRFSLHV